MNEKLSIAQLKNTCVDLKKHVIDMIYKAQSGHPGGSLSVAEFVTACYFREMNVNPADAGAELLIVSQFTLYADVKSRRPGFTRAARPDTAVPLYERVIAECRSRGFKVETGQFGAEMLVESVNDGPVTILIDTDEL